MKSRGFFCKSAKILETAKSQHRKKTYTGRIWWIWAEQGWAHGNKRRPGARDSWAVLTRPHGPEAEAAGGAAVSGRSSWALASMWRRWGMVAALVAGSPADDEARSFFFVEKQFRQGLPEVRWLSDVRSVNGCRTSSNCRTSGGWAIAKLTSGRRWISWMWGWGNFLGGLEGEKWEGGKEPDLLTTQQIHGSKPTKSHKNKQNAKILVWLFLMGIFELRQKQTKLD